MATRASGSQNPKLDEVTDLATLSSISDDIILSCLRERYLSGHLYTAIGSNAVVVVNPYKYTPSSGDATLVQYAMEFREVAEEKTYRDPHVFQLANNAYYNMRRTGQDQSILMRYASASAEKIAF